jgi:hypothetical protein
VSEHLVKLSIEGNSTSPFSASEPPNMATRQQIECGKKQNDIEIVTCNIEGLKTNILFLQSFSTKYNFVSGLIFLNDIGNNVDAFSVFCLRAVCACWHICVYQTDFC